MHVQHTFLHIVVRADDSLRTKISWMHFGHFPFTQNLRNFGNSGNWYSIFPEKFPDFRKSFRNGNLSTRNFRHSGANLVRRGSVEDVRQRSSEIVSWMTWLGRLGEECELRFFLLVCLFSSFKGIQLLYFKCIYFYVASLPSMCKSFFRWKVRDRQQETCLG